MSVWFGGFFLHKLWYKEVFFMINYCKVKMPWGLIYKTMHSMYRQIACAKKYLTISTTRFPLYHMRR